MGCGGSSNLSCRCQLYSQNQSFCGQGNWDLDTFLTYFGLIPDPVNSYKTLKIISVDKNILFPASSGTYSIKNGFKNAVTQCNGTYLESNNVINPGLTSNVQISATVSCSADIENKVVDCSTFTGAIKDLVITPVDQSCIVKADTTPSAGSFNIKNNFTNAATQCIGAYFDSKIAINPELTRDVQISVTVSCSANIEGTTVNCGTYTGTIQDLVIEPVEQSCFVVPKSSPGQTVHNNM